MALENLTDEIQEDQKSHESQFPQGVNRFFDLFFSLLSEGEGHLADSSTGKRPRFFFYPEHFGWKSVSDDPPKYKRQGRCVGWVDEFGEVYLNPHAIYDALQFWAAFKNLPLPYTFRGLWALLSSNQVIIREKRGHQPKRTICGESIRVIHLPVSSMVRWLAREGKEDMRLCFEVLRNRA